MTDFFEGKIREVRKQTGPDYHWMRVVKDLDENAKTYTLKKDGDPYGGEDQWEEVIDYEAEPSEHLDINTDDIPLGTLQIRGDGEGWEVTWTDD